MRVKVRIVCKNCGERYVLRGSRQNGVIQTGFKQCLCSSRSGFEIEEES
ncbi:hypothetical protein ACE6ED_04880 [Paenibacillus sp. CN-4]